MSKPSRTTITRLLTLPLLLPIACSDAEAPADTGDNSHIALRSLQISSSDAPHLLQPVTVSVDAQLHGDAYETDLVIGMRSLSAGTGCVLGGMPVQHAGADEDVDVDAGQAYHFEREFNVGLDCFDLVGLEDVELFAAFDPFKQLDGAPFELPEDVDPSTLSLYTVIEDAALGVDGCESCETVYPVHAAPGRDAKLLEVDMSSTIAVLPVAGEDGVEPIAHNNKPAFTVSTLSQVTGLREGAGLPDGSVELVYRLRPLGSSDSGVALPVREHGRQLDHKPVSVSGDGDLVSVAMLDIDGAARDLVVDGAWSDVDEFELETCLATDFEQAIFAGENEPRANDCAAIPVVLVRAPVGADGHPANAGAASARSAEVWGDTWSAGSNKGFGSSSFTFETWLEINATDSATSTYGGIDVSGPGSWFEAGIDSHATVFGYYASIIDIYATFIAYDFGGGGAAMGASVVGIEFLPEFEFQLSNGEPVSLQDMFDLAGITADPSVTEELTIAGINFDDGCGTVTAGVWLEGTLGIDTEETTVTVGTTSEGVGIDVVLTPYMSITANAGTSVHYSFISGGITATLDLLDLTLPFEVSAEYIDYSPIDAARLTLTESATANLSTLSGSITYYIDYYIVWPIEGHHSGTIASWNGLDLEPIDFFSATQTINFGSEAPSSGWCTSTSDQLFEGDFNGDGESDYLCHESNVGNNTIDYGPSYGGTDWTGGNWCINGRQVLVGDFDGDGRDDLLCHSSSRKWIDYADSSGHFGGTNWYYDTTWCAPNELSSPGDLNGDGRDDLLCSSVSSDTMWIDYADSSGHFNWSDWSGTELPDVLPSFIEIGTADVSTSWITITHNAGFTDPVVILGPASYNETDPVVFRVRNVGSNSFDVKIREWVYDDHNHGNETIAWMVVEGGVHTADDGSIWEAGTFTAGGAAETKTKGYFSGSYSSAPLLLATQQTDGDPFALRVDNLGASSFDVILDEEEAITDGHSDVTIGYLAISGTPQSTASHTIYSGEFSVDENWAPIFDFELMVQEETSADSEVAHNNETVDVLAFYGTADTMIFAQDVSYSGTDTANIRWQWR